MWLNLSRSKESDAPVYRLHIGCFFHYDLFVSPPNMIVLPWHLCILIKNVLVCNILVYFVLWFELCVFTTFLQFTRFCFALFRVKVRRLIMLQQMEAYMHSTRSLLRALILMFWMRSYFLYYIIFSYFLYFFIVLQRFFNLHLSSLMWTVLLYYYFFSSKRT